MGIAYGYQLYPRKRATRYEVWVDGLPLSSICTYSDLRTSTRLIGDWQASWKVLRHRQRDQLIRHPAFREGAPVEVKLGPIVAWVGTFPEQDFRTGDMIALGAAREAEGALCFTGTGETTTKPNTAIAQAIARGAVNWIRRDDFGNTAVGQGDDASSSFSRLSELLDARCEELGQQWRIDRRRGLVLYTLDETDPTWLITPGSDDMGVAGDERVDRFFVRYISDAVGNPLATASYPASTPAGGFEKGAAITNRGPMSAAEAQTIAQSVWSKLEGRTGWTNGTNVTKSMITTKGDIPPELGLVKAGEAMRRLGAPDPRSLAKHVDVVIGETECEWDREQLQLNPVGMVSFNRVLEDTSPGAVPLN